MATFQRLWVDEEGFIVSAELVLIATIVVIGLIVGLAVLRNQVVQELVDVSQALGALSQSYCFGGTWKPGVAWTDATCYIDLVDFCQTPQVPGFPPGGISVTVFPIGAPPAAPGGERPF